MRLPLVLGGFLACSCGACAGSKAAAAETQLVTPSQTKSKQFDLPRDKFQDTDFAQEMARDMDIAEEAVADRKRLLFQRLLRTLPEQGATVVEVGIGCFPNAIYLASEDAPRGMDIIGVDPNDSMEEFARDSAKRLGLLEPQKKNRLRLVHGVAEALPLASGTADAVVCTMTLCSVLEPGQAVAEIRRILKPGGRYLFHEHVISETDPKLAAEQRMYKGKGGCNFDRRTLQTIRAGGFRDVDAEYFDLTDYWLLNPTIEGIATA